MTRLLIAVPALFAVVALSGALGPPQAAVAQEPAASQTDSVTVTEVGTVEDTPDQAQMSFGVETRGRTAQAAIAANATALAKVIAALRQAGGRDLATQSISVWPVAREDGTIESYSASNGVSATIGVARVGALIDAAAEAGANQISGPGMKLQRRRPPLPRCAREGRRRRAAPRRGAREGRGPHARGDLLDVRGRLSGTDHLRQGRGGLRRVPHARRPGTAGRRWRAST